MASVNEQLPDLSGNTLQFSKIFGSNVTPEAPKAGATLLRGIGDALDTGIKGVNDALEQHFQFLGEKAGDQAQSDMLSNVTFADNVSKGGTGQDSGAPQTPAQINNALQYLQRNKDAYDQGKLRETEYLRNLYEKAKSIRQQFPQYSQYFDRGVEKVTGITPNANRLIESMLSDINSRRSKDEEVTKAIVNHALTEAAKGNTEASIAVQNFLNGKGDRYQLLTAVTKSNIPLRQAEVTGANYKTVESLNGMDRIEANRAIGNAYSQKQEGMFQGFKVDVFGTEENMEQLMQDQANGKLPKMSDEWWADVARKWQTYQTSFNAQMEKAFNQPNRPGGVSLRAAAGSDYDNTVKSAQKIGSDMLKAITEQNVGLMWGTEFAVKARNNENLKTFQDDKDWGPFMAISNAFKTFGGEAWMPNVWSQLNSILPQGTPVLDKQKLLMMYGRLASGLDASMSGAIDKYENSNRDAAGNKLPTNPDIVNALIKQFPVDTISNPKNPEQLRRNAIMSTFRPGQENFLARVPARTTVNGKTVEGREDVYQAYGDLAPAIHKLADGHDKLWEIYRNYMENQFTQTVFGDTVKAMSQESKDRSIALSFNDKSDPPRFEMTRVHRGGLTGTETPIPVSGTEEALIERANRGLAGFWKVVKEEGGTVEKAKADILNVMKANDVNINVGDSLARAGMVAVGATRKPATAKDVTKPAQVAP